MAKTKEEIDKAVAQPWTVYHTPEEVLANGNLDDRQKRRVLESWEHDARELAVAEEENMGGGEPDLLDRVLKALGTLPAEDDRPRGPATTHGSQPSPSSAPEGGATEISAEDARQGQTVLNTPLRRSIFFGGAIILGVAILVWAVWA